MKRILVVMFAGVALAAVSAGAWADEPAAKPPAVAGTAPSTDKTAGDADIKLPALESIPDKAPAPSPQPAPAAAPAPTPAMTWNTLAPWAFPWESYGRVSRKDVQEPLDAFGNPQVDADEWGDEPDPDPSEVVKRVLENMAKSEELLLEKKNAGELTQLVQKDIEKDLNQLVELAKQKQQKQDKKKQQQQKQKGGDSKQQGQQQGQPQNQGQKQAQQKAHGKQAAQKEAYNPGQAQNPELADVESRLAELWGTLPGVDAKQTAQGLQEMVLPKYRELLSRYYYELSRQGTGTNNSNNGGEK